MFSGKPFLLLISVVFCVTTLTTPIFAQILFTQPPVKMVDSLHEYFDQTGVSSCFDFHDNVHTSWIDTWSGHNHSYASSILANGMFVGSYELYAGSSTDDHSFTRSFPDFNDTHLLFSITLNDSSSPNPEFCGSELNIPDFPSFPNVVDTSCAMTANSMVDMGDFIYADGKIIYIASEESDLRLRAYDVATQTWDASEVVIAATGSYELFHPKMAADNDGYIYVVYDRFNSSTSKFDIGACRSVLSGDIQGGFGPEHSILATTADVEFDPDVAVTGAYSASDLVFAVSFVESITMATNVSMSHEVNGDWTDNMYPSTIPLVLNTDNSPTLNVNGPDSVFDFDGDTLYVIWVDDRSGTGNLYLRAVSNNASSPSDELCLLSGAIDIVDPPHISAGYNPGNLAVTYLDQDGGSVSPFLLLSRASFFDTCDADPSAYWTSYSGVTVVPSPHHGPTGSSYRLENSKTRGSLLQDYGSVEQTGSISLFFYDDPAIVTEDFIVTMNNDNSRGVIRMLGVRNDTASNYYSYSMDGVTWQSMAAQRFLGWHEIIITVNASGITMQLEPFEGSGTYLTVTDSAFTSFTSIEIEGGGPTGAYNVDDIRVEAYPINNTSPNIPSSSPFSILAGAFLLGLFIWLKRS